MTEKHLVASEAVTLVLVKLMNDLFSNGNVTDIMKQTVLTPVFKRKGSSTEAKIYRGIFVTLSFLSYLNVSLERESSHILNSRRILLREALLLDSPP